MKPEEFIFGPLITRELGSNLKSSEELMKTLEILRISVHCNFLLSEKFISISFLSIVNVKLDLASLGTYCEFLFYKKFTSNSL